MTLASSSFTFQRTAPCDSWNAFGKRARKQWDIYRDVTRFKSITRVGLRYVNKFEWQGESAREILNVYPAVPDNLGTSMSGLLRLEPTKYSRVVYHSHTSDTRLAWRPSYFGHRCDPKRECAAGRCRIVACPFAIEQQGVRGI